MAKSYSTSPHFSRHFTHWHFLAACMPKSAFYTWSYFRNITNLSNCFVIASDDRYETIIVAKDITVNILTINSNNTYKRQIWKWTIFR